MRQHVVRKTWGVSCRKKVPDVDLTLVAGPVCNIENLGGRSAWRPIHGGDDALKVGEGQREM